MGVLRVTCVVLLAMLEAGVAHADPAASLTREQVDKLLAANTVKPVAKKAGIPKVWHHAIGLDREGGVSDIGGPFESGCVGDGPHQRLVTAVIAEPYAFVIVEQGGIAYLRFLRVYEHRENVVEVYSEVLNGERLATVCKRLGASCAPQ